MENDDYDAPPVAVAVGRKKENTTRLEKTKKAHNNAERSVSEMSFSGASADGICLFLPLSSPPTPPPSRLSFTLSCSTLSSTRASLHPIPSLHPPSSPSQPTLCSTLKKNMPFIFASPFKRIKAKASSLWPYGHIPDTGRPGCLPLPRSRPSLLPVFRCGCLCWWTVVYGLWPVLCCECGAPSHLAPSSRLPASPEPLASAPQRRVDAARLAHPARPMRPPPWPSRTAHSTPPPTHPDHLLSTLPAWAATPLPARRAHPSIAGATKSIARCGARRAC